MTKDVGKVVHYPIGSCIEQLLPRTIAIAYSASAATGPTSHQNVIGHVAYDKCLFRRHLKMTERDEHRLWVGLGTLHFIATQHKAKKTVEL